MLGLNLNHVSKRATVCEYLGIEYCCFKWNECLEVFGCKTLDIVPVHKYEGALVLKIQIPFVSHLDLKGHAFRINNDTLLFTL